ncbi:MAG: hypothetical protein JST20_00195 [Bacteroidetes bacterium]|nr:hypothetical protein [Bacteroidota bacterium]
MKKLDCITTIEISSQQIKAAKNFALKVIETVDYSDSNQINKRKIADDHFISKLGEEAVKNCYENLGFSVSPIDYNIYNGKQKSWESDLTINNFPLAVKTQKKSAALKYGLSWTFQLSGFRNDPILLNPEGWVCFVECDDTHNFLCRVFPPLQIKLLTFREPKLAHLKGKKKVVYAEDFVHL